jgi:hypothetical protein
MEQFTFITTNDHIQNSSQKAKVRSKSAVAGAKARLKTVSRNGFVSWDGHGDVWRTRRLRPKGDVRVLDSGHIGRDGHPMMDHRTTLAHLHPGMPARTAAELDRVAVNSEKPVAAACAVDFIGENGLTDGMYSVSSATSSPTSASETEATDDHVSSTNRSSPVAAYDWQGKVASISHKMLPTMEPPVFSTTFDPFSSSPPMIDREVQQGLHFYFKIIRPFTSDLIHGWRWHESLSEVQAQPALAYAIAAFSSAFVSGCARGGPGVVLPPLPFSGRVRRSNEDRLLWPLPPWLRLHTRCIRELSETLKQESDGNQDGATFQAILFLFRLSVLLADGPGARSHLKALETMMRGSQESHVLELGKELAVQRINVVAAFCQQESVVVVETKRKGAYVVEIDRRDWDDGRYWSHLAPLNGRAIAWRSDTLMADGEEANRRPGDWIRRDCEAALEIMDPRCRGALREAGWEQLVIDCFQLALHIGHYLNSVSFDTGDDGVRRQLLRMKRRLNEMDLEKLSVMARTTLFYVLLVGAKGSRGRLERPWFVQHLAVLYEGDMRSINDVLAMVKRCVDPSGVCWPLVKEIWHEVVERRAEVFGSCHLDLDTFSLEVPTWVNPTGGKQDRSCQQSGDQSVSQRRVIRETVYT